MCWNKGAHEHDRNDLTWNNFDDYMWSEDMVYCWRTKQHGCRVIGTDEMPDDCLYKLEHVVMDEGQNE